MISKMQLTHAGDDRLLCFRVGEHAESGDLLAPSAATRCAELVLIALGFGLDRLRDDRLREGDVFQLNGRLFVAQRVAGACIGEADRRRDVARADRIDVFAMIGSCMRRMRLRDALLATAARIVHVRAPFRARRSTARK